MKQWLWIVCFIGCSALTQGSNLIINVDGRDATSLNGRWNIIVDPYEFGYYDYRYQVSRNGFFRNAKPRNKSDLVEYSFDTDLMLQVPGDWNSQDDRFFFYEGTLWYKTAFNITPQKTNGTSSISARSTTMPRSISTDVRSVSTRADSPPSI